MSKGIFVTTPFLNIHPATAVPGLSTPIGPGPDPGALSVLVLDDSAAQRNMACAFLRKWGHRAIATGDPLEALEIARDPAISLILCDWMMPQMTGPEFCRRLRAEVTEHYAYILLLTSKNEGGALAEGLEAGADDFLNKPIRAPELHARMNAGARIVQMQRELRSKNTLLEATLDEVQVLYGAIDRDLEEARRLQRASLQDESRRFGPADVSLLLEPSGHVGGDMVGYFSAGQDTVGLFSLDVSGHGVASAIVAARVAGMLSDASPDQNIALTRGADGQLHAVSPELVAERLNRVMLQEVQSDRYFTICLAFLNLATGALKMVQAGHPHPIIHRANGEYELIGEGGMPVGLIDDIPFAGYEARLNPGDRLLMYSDGLTECPDPDEVLLDEDGLLVLMGNNATARGTDFLARLRQGLVDYSQTDDFPDDLSALLVEVDAP